MTKRTLLAIVTASCIALLTACSAQPAQPSSVGASVSLQTESASPSASDTASSAIVTDSDSPSPSESAKATKKPSTDSNASGSGSSASSGASGSSVGQVIKADDVNQQYASSLKTDGEDIKVTIQEDTFTFNVTLDQDIKPADFTNDMKSQYMNDMNKQIQTIISEYPNIPDCMFAYNLMNHSGEVLMKQTQFYQAE